MFAIFRNRNFSLLWLAGLISIMGNWVLIAALPFHVYAVTQSALATSGWLMAYILPGVLFGSMAGVFVDRWDRRKTMIVINLMQMGVLLALLLVRSPEWIWVVYVVGFLESTLSQFFGPAESALLPTLVDEEQLVSANSLNSLNDNLARIIGPAIGGALLAMWGLTAVVIADALSYMMAALFIGLMIVPAKRKVTESDAPKINVKEKFVAVWQEWIAGLKVVVKSRPVANMFLIMGVALFADAILSAIWVVFLQGDVGLSATEFSWVLLARGVGGLFAGLLMTKIGQKLSNRQLASWGLLGSALLMFVIAFQPTLPVILGATFLAGFPAIAWIVAAQTELQQATEDEFRGRVFGAFGTTVSLVMLLSSGLAGLSADLLGAKALIVATGAIWLLSGMMAWFLIRPVALKSEPMATAVGD
jgi:predicted MFS family arabinose efflux permease